MAHTINAMAYNFSMSLFPYLTLGPKNLELPRIKQKISWIFLRHGSGSGKAKAPSAIKQLWQKLTNATQITQNNLSSNNAVSVSDSLSASAKSSVDSNATAENFSTFSGSSLNKSGSLIFTTRGFFFDSKQRKQAEIIVDQTSKKMDIYPESLEFFFEKNKNVISLDAMDALMRGVATYNLLLYNKTKIREILLLYLYSSGDLNSNLLSLRTFLARGPVKKLLSSIPEKRINNQVVYNHEKADFTEFFKNFSDNPQIAAELSSLDYKQIQKFDEALAIIPVNRAITTPTRGIVFLNQALIDSFKLNPNLAADDTRNTNWDLVLVDNDTYIPLDIKNTKDSLTPKNNLYRLQEERLHFSFTQYKIHLRHNIETKINTFTKNIQNKQEHEIADLRAVIQKLSIIKDRLNKIDTTTIGDELNISLDSWNLLCLETKGFLKDNNIGINYLSFTEAAKLKNIVSSELRLQFYSFYHQAANNHLQEAITKHYFKQQIVSKNSEEVDKQKDNVNINKIEEMHNQIDPKFIFKPNTREQLLSDSSMILKQAKIGLKKRKVIDTDGEELKNLLEFVLSTLNVDDGSV
jgi:hypothetical protein